MEANEPLDTFISISTEGDETARFPSAWKESETSSLVEETLSKKPEYFKAGITSISDKPLAQTAGTMEVNTLYVPTYEAGYHSNGYLGALEKEVKRAESQETDLISEVLGDDTALFIALKINQGENKSVGLSELYDHLRGPEALIPFSKLSAARVVEIVGNHVCLTVKGERLLEAFNSFSQNGGS